MTRRDPAPRAWHRLRSPMRQAEYGSAGIELLITATTSVALILVVVATGRSVDAQGQATDAAYAAARAASLHPDGSTAAAIAAGEQAARDSLAERGKSCRHLTISFVGSDFNPGGQVIAQVRCTVSLVDTGAIGTGLGLEQTQVSKRAVVPIETYRVQRSR